MSRWHAQQWTVVEAIERPPAAAVTALAGFATTQIADCGGPVGVVVQPVCAGLPALEPFLPLPMPLLVSHS